MRMSYIEILGQKHPVCLSLTAAAELEDACGGLSDFLTRVKTSSFAKQTEYINKTVEILLKAGRIYASASGLELPDPLPCSPADLIDVMDAEVIDSVFAVFHKDTEREVETVPKNQDAAQDL